VAASLLHGEGRDGERAAHLERRARIVDDLGTITPKLGPFRRKGTAIVVPESAGATMLVAREGVVTVISCAGRRSRLPTHLASAGLQATSGGFCGMLTMIPLPSP